MISKPAWGISGGIFDSASLKKRLAELEELMSAPDFWNAREAAQKTIEEANGIKSRIEPLNELNTRWADIDTFLELYQEETDEEGRESLADLFLDIGPE